MADWKKLDKQFYNKINSMTKQDWIDWKNRNKHKVMGRFDEIEKAMSNMKIKTGDVILIINDKHKELYIGMVIITESHSVVIHTDGFFNLDNYVAKDGTLKEHMSFKIDKIYRPLEHSYSLNPARWSKIKFLEEESEYKLIWSEKDGFTEDDEKEDDENWYLLK